MKQKHIITRFGIALVLLFIGQRGVLAGADPFQEFLNVLHSLKTLQAHFTQSVEGSTGGESAEGRLWLKRPYQMRWDYEPPERKVFLLEKGRFRFYLPSDNQLIIQKMDQSDVENSPLVFLLGGRRNLTDFYQVQALDRKAGETRYLLTAISGDTPFTKVILSLAGNPPFIGEMVLFEENGVIHTYRFTQVKLNLPVPEEIFHFTPPSGVEVVYQE